MTNRGIKEISNSFYSSQEMTWSRFFVFCFQSHIGDMKTKMAYGAVVSLIEWLLVYA